MKACGSILNFIGSLITYSHLTNLESVRNALIHNNRGLMITKIFVAGIAGALISGVECELENAFYAISSWSDKLELEWFKESVNLIPEFVLSYAEKRSFVEDFKTAVKTRSKGLFIRVVLDLTKICYRSRVTRSMAQRVLLPEELQDAATWTTN